MPHDNDAESNIAMTQAPNGFRFFHANTQPEMRNAHERGTLRSDYVPPPATVEGLKRFGAAVSNGATARVLYAANDMHIAYVWFKSGFPLPLHSHDADCFYQIIAGSMNVGTEELRQGDGVLIPGGAPYTVSPGPEGVEFIEIRPTQDYDTRYHGKTKAYWDRIIGTLQAHKEAWATEKAPFGLLTGTD